ncbi:MAG: discoidin domain-containing protein [Bifidobacteriaceae bacterium]|jgi:hypothetical protein|nr:discoidin domain-containing protein [Bifidobacteriaceae bacterium]
MKQQHERGRRAAAGFLALALGAGLVPLAFEAPALAAGDNSVVDSWAPAGGRNVAPGATVTAHNYQPAWPPSYLVDGNTGTAGVNLWVANDTALDAHGWVQLDLAEEAEVVSVVLFPRGEGNFYGVYYPAKFTVSLLDSGGATVWSTEVSHTNSSAITSRIITSPDVIEVEPAVPASAVRIDVIERHARENGVLQLAEVAVFAQGEIVKYNPAGTVNLAKGAAVSAESTREAPAAGWGLQYLNDEVLGSASGWSSQSLPKVEDPEKPTWVQYDLGAMASVARLAVFPHSANFPADYRLQISDDAQTWADVAFSAGNPDAPDAPQIYDFQTSLSARHVRLWVDIRSSATSDAEYGYLAQLAEVAVFGNYWTLDQYAPAGTWNLARDAYVSASSSYEMPGETWSTEFARNEQVAGDGWTTNPYERVADATKPAWLAYDFSCAANLQRLVVYPRPGANAAYFPRQYRLQTSGDAVTWDTVATFADNTAPQTSPQWATLTPAVSARYARLHVDVRNGPAGVDGYLAQISEFAVFGTQSCAAATKPALAMNPGSVETSWFLARGVDGLAFESSNTQVATVDAEGRITAVADGQATVTGQTPDAATTVSTEVAVGERAAIGSDILVAAYWAPSPGYTTPEQYATIADFGLDLIMGNDEHPSLPENLEMAKLAADNGFLYLVSEGRVSCGALSGATSAQVQAILDDYSNVPGVGGLLLCDEAMPATNYATAFNTVADYTPELYPHYNFCPWGACGVNQTSVRAWLEATGGTRSDWSAPDYLMYDMYPLKATIGFSSWFNNLEVIRALGLEYQIKTATYLQAVGYGGSTPSRAPTAAEIAWEANAALAYGYKQLAYFTYWQPTNRSEVFTEAVMKADGTKSERFDDLKALNSEIHALGPVLMNLDAQDVYFNGANHGQKAAPATLAAPNADGTLTAGTFFAKADANQDLLLSHLVDRHTKEHYLFVVNNTFSGTTPTAAEVTLTFDESVSGLTLVSREDGSLTPVALTSHELALNLAGGEGQLYRLSVPAANKAALVAAIAEAEAFTEGDYTLASWAALQSALSAADVVSGDDAATQEQVDGAVLALRSAINGLELSGPDVSSSVAFKCAAGRVYLAVTVVNDEDVEPVSLALSGPFGSKSFASVAPGRTATASFNTLTASLSQGGVLALAAGVAGGEPVVSDVVYGTYACGG